MPGDDLQFAGCEAIQIIIKNFGSFAKIDVFPTYSHVFPETARKVEYLFIEGIERKPRLTSFEAG
jgi:hypothetical protein